jgi:hypothetical protein
MEVACHSQVLPTSVAPHSPDRVMIFWDEKDSLNPPRSALHFPADLLGLGNEKHSAAELNSAVDLPECGDWEPASRPASDLLADEFLRLAFREILLELGNCGDSLVWTPLVLDCRVDLLRLANWTLASHLVPGLEENSPLISLKIPPGIDGEVRLASIAGVFLSPLISRKTSIPFRGNAWF